MGVISKGHGNFGENSHSGPKQVSESEWMKKTSCKHSSSNTRRLATYWPIAGAQFFPLEKGIFRYGGGGN